MKRSKLSNTFLLSILLCACGPKLEEKQRNPVSIPQGEKFQDEVIFSFADKTFASENRINRKNGSDRLIQTEMLLDIAATIDNLDWNKKSERFYLDQEKKLDAKKLGFANSIYLDLVNKQIQSEVNSSVNDADRRIALDTQKVISLIRKKQEDSLILFPESTLSEKLKIVQNFLDILIAEVKPLKIMKDFKETFIVELQKQSQTLLTDAIDFDDNLVRSETLSASLKIISAYLKKSSTQLSSEDQTNLNLGLQLASAIDNLNDAQSGLQVLSLVWTLLNSEQRKQYFQTANSDLYDFLNKKSADDIQCMSEKNCRGIKTKIVLSVGVYPAIEKFGLKNIADLVNQKGVHFINQKVNQVAYNNLLTVGETITQQVLTSVTQKRNDLIQFKDNLRIHLSKGMEQEWARQKLMSPQFLLKDLQNGLLDFDSQTTYLRSKIKSLRFLRDKSSQLQTQFEVLEGILNLPLYSQTSKSSSKILPDDLIEIIFNPQPRQFLNSVTKSSGEINLKQQSELLLTTSMAINELADWKITSFDKGLSSIKASQILTAFKSKDLERSFFPKSNLLAIVLSISSQVLKSLQGENSPLILVDNLNRILSVQNLFSIPSGPIVLAAATDFKKSTRVSVVNASDLSEFLIALNQFYRASEGIEQTASSVLKNNGLLKEVLDARQSIKLLMIAIGNFISNQLIQSNGLVSKAILLNENLKPIEQYELLDQTRAIEALVQVYEATHIDVYLWTAKTIYHSINRHLYSQKMKFYQLSTENFIQSGIDTTKLLETYKNLIKLKPYLSTEQQVQFEKIFEAWIDF